jgi:protein phosphatase 2C family protein 2/3
MGDTLGKPVTDKNTTLYDSPQMVVAATGMQGWRKKMEDAHVIEFKIGNNRHAAFLAVFDGHNGSGAAKYCSIHLLDKILSQPDFKSKTYEAALEKAFISIDEDLGQSAHRDEGGCTAVAVLVIEGKLFCANAGDSRAVAYFSTRGVVPLSEDHKPTVPAEIERIQQAGGTIQNGRVNGVLGLTRALGDFEFKPDGPNSAITCRPDVRAVEITPDLSFIVAACDGIWEVLSSESVCDFVRKQLADGFDAGQICESLIDQCIADSGHGLGTDNMTVTLWLPKQSFFSHATHSM